MSATPSGRTQRGWTLHVDWTACQARGACLELMPELLQADEFGYPLAAGTGRERTDIPLREADLPAARDAVALCPRMALQLRPPR